MPPILVTGAAGFIGFHTCERLLAQGRQVLGLDNLNAYYDPTLKDARLARLMERPGFEFVKLDLCDRSGMEALFAERRFERVVNLAAQAGVRYSLTSPHSYVDSNITGFLNVLEGCRHNAVGHLVFASSSSVYGADTAMPFNEHRGAGHPINLYAATKRANELMAHAYAHLFRVPTTGLRFFTVYGPFGRPDMALFLFTRAILEGRPIEVFNNGEMRRDFTYVDDVVEGIVRLLDRVPEPNPEWTGQAPDPATSTGPFRVYNIGNHTPVRLMDMIRVLEECLGREAVKEWLPMQPGDVPMTWSDVGDLTRDAGYDPHTPIEVGVRNFVEWYRGFYGV